MAMAGEPLSQEVSTHSALSMDSVLEVASRLADERGPTREPTSTSGRINEEEEEDEIAVSNEDLQSTLSAEDSV